MGTIIKIVYICNDNNNDFNVTEQEDMMEEDVVQDVLNNYETGFHSDSYGNIIHEIIVKADFDSNFIIASP